MKTPGAKRRRGRGSGKASTAGSNDGNGAPQMTMTSHIPHYTSHKKHVYSVGSTVSFGYTSSCERREEVPVVGKPGSSLLPRVGFD